MGDFNLIIKKFSGELDDEENRAFKTWYDASPENRHLYEQLHQIWQKSSMAPPQSPDLEKEWRKLQKKIENDT